MIKHNLNKYQILLIIREIICNFIFKAGNYIVTSLMMGEYNFAITLYLIPIFIIPKKMVGIN